MHIVVVTIYKYAIAFMKIKMLVIVFKISRAFFYDKEEVRCKILSTAAVRLLGSKSADFLYIQ